MKKTIFIISLALAVAFVLGTATVQSQPGRGGYGYGIGPGYGLGPGMMGGWIDVPAKLPAPKNAEWVQKLREILTLENQSLAQYQADQEKFNAYMPYLMIIPQEENHIEWIGQLFKAYSLSSDGKAGPVVENKTLTEAYELSTKMESDLLPRYEWLVKNAGDRDTAQALNTILLQSRGHLVMFEHALRMGHGYGYSRGSGMMGGYGSGYGMGPGMMGPGYGPQGPGGWNPMMHYGFGYGGMFMWIILLIIVGVLIYFIVQAQKTKGQTSTPKESPLDLLKKRYAKGEIAKEEYERMKKDLEG